MDTGAERKEGRNRDCAPGTSVKQRKRKQTGREQYLIINNSGRPSGQDGNAIWDNASRRAVAVLAARCRKKG
ncbi:hypothetical protein HNY73_008295 [Argiope bruennichi]|uniref:Uncharacterized protein n=1 Tax=Argiope bruennichi TaxID=94029 RepID=A0A8T0F6X0_ARGBR|nr:hypothetical protein HNY73_008295 [Argiope bruennichi]